MAVQWVLKISKFCNLRCKYCYEYPWLGDASRIHPDDIARFFRHVADYYRAQPQKMDFVWHGGEPLLQERDYFDEVFEQQTAILGEAGVPFQNSVQTNLFSVRDSTLRFLKQRFQNIGVSVDVFGDLRVSAGGRAAQPKVLENMQRLMDADIRFGCITVLSRANHLQVEAIYQFFEELSLAFRLLPVYRTGFPHQQEPYALGPEEIVRAFCTVVDRWFTSDSLIQVRPVQDYITNVIRHFAGPALHPRRYDDIPAEVLFILNTNGDLYSNADAYDPACCYGNVFSSPLKDVLHSASATAARAARHLRMRATCHACAHFGGCSGFYMGEATPEQRFRDGNERLLCGVVQPVQNYVVGKLVAEGILDPKSGTLDRSQLDFSLLQPERSDAPEF